MEEVDLKFEKVTVEAKSRPLLAPKYILPFPILWRIEKFIRWVINKPAPKVPYTIEIEQPMVCCHSKEAIEDLKKSIVEECMRRR